MRGRKSLVLEFQDRVFRGWENVLRFSTPTLRLIGALIIAALGVALSLYLHRHGASHDTAILMLVAVFMSLWCGLALGIVFTLLTGFAIDLLALPPIGSVLSNFESWELLTAAVIASLVGTLVSSLRFAFQRMDLAKQEAERAKQEAEAAVRARDEIVGVISHELKNPLTALLTGVTLIERVFPRTEENGNALKLIERLKPSLHRMGGLVSDLLDVTRLEAHALKLEPTDCDLGQIVREVLSVYEAPAQEKLIQLSADIPQDVGRVFCDSRRTIQILTNLLSNAIKFTNEGGSVRVAAKKTGDQIEVRVEDNGRGISKDSIPHIFNRFWQAKDTAYRGTGLGLSIAKGLVDAQGGKIWVESEAGEKTTFFFTLPTAASIRKLVPRQAAS